MRVVCVRSVWLMGVGVLGPHWRGECVLAVWQGALSCLGLCVSLAMRDRARAGCGPLRVCVGHAPLSPSYLSTNLY